MTFLDEERFTHPTGWRSGEFYNVKTGHRIHYATVSPTHPVASVVLLQGLSEFTEKYHELSRELLARGFRVWTLDWSFQGRSSRLKKTPMRRHSDGFDADINDLHKLISDYVLPFSRGQKLVLLGHSMGGHIGLRYLARHQGIFSAAAFSAPMLGIAQANRMPPIIQDIILKCLSPFKTSYMPFGKDWHETMRQHSKTKFSSDPIRDELQMAWTHHYPELRIGAPTVRWVYEAIMSCRAMRNELQTITIPTMIAYAGADTIVDNAAICHGASLIPQCHLVELYGAHHEIFMERDHIRQQFMSAFDNLLQTADI